MASRRQYRRHRSPGGEEGEGRPRKRRGGIIVFLLASALPLGVLGWYLLLPEERRQALADKIPSGVGGRAISAGIAFGALLVLARVALPAFFGASRTLRGVLDRMRGFRLPLRIVAFPAEALIWLLWFVLQLLFAVDAFLIIAAAAVGLLLVVRILKPDFLPGILPELTR